MKKTKVWLEKKEWDKLVNYAFFLIKKHQIPEEKIFVILKTKYKNYSNSTIQSAINIARDRSDVYAIFFALEVDWFSWPIKKILRRAQNATHRINQIALEKMIKKMIRQRIVVYAEERVMFKHRKMKPHEIAKAIANRVWAKEQFSMLVKACSAIKKKREREWREKEKKYKKFKKSHKEIKRRQLLKAQQQARDQNLVSLSEFKKEKRRDMRQTS